MKIIDYATLSPDAINALHQEVDRLHTLGDVLDWLRSVEISGNRPLGKPQVAFGAFGKENPKALLRHRHPGVRCVKEELNILGFVVGFRGVAAG